jgi:L-aminopeptidase/D-esterase-like protein
VSARASAAAPAAADFRRFGVAIGHATDTGGATGCTVVRGADGPLRGAAAIVGRATGTRELALLEPGHLVDRVDALLLSGGSAYGLDAAAGVMRWCEERGRGFPVGPGVVPIVPAAVVFDLAPLGSFAARPTPSMAWHACEHASARDVAEGSVGAGTGATCAKVQGVAHATKGGIGCAVVARDGLAAGAIVVVNAFGVVHDGAGRPLVARALDADATGDPSSFADAAGRSTTIGAVVVDVPLSKLALRGVAVAASAAFHRRIVPSGSPFDGDVLFALAPMAWVPGGDASAARGAPPEHHDTTSAATGRHPQLADRTTIAPGGIDPDPALALALERLAVEATERAIERAVRLARGRDGVPGLADA